MANEFKVRKGLVVNGSGSVILDVQGSQGQLFSVTDQLSGSLFSVNDISGVPVLEAFSDSTVKIGQYLSEAIVVSGSTARITGSIAMTGFSSGSVLFAGPGGSITQNNANFFWDNTNGRLGIGTNAPTYTLEMRGQRFYHTGTTTTPATTLYNIVDNTSTSNNSYVLFGVDINGNTVGFTGRAGTYLSTGANGGTQRALILHNYDNQPIVFATNNTERARIFGGGNLAIGFTSDSGERLQVLGSSRFTSDMVITGSVTIRNGELNLYKPTIASGSLATFFGYQNPYQHELWIEVGMNQLPETTAVLGSSNVQQNRGAFLQTSGGSRAVSFNSAGQVTIGNGQISSSQYSALSIGGPSTNLGTISTSINGVQLAVLPKDFIYVGTAVSPQPFITFNNFATSSIRSVVYASAYTNAATVYIEGAPSSGQNVTYANRYALYVQSGSSYFGGGAIVSGSLNVTQGITGSLFGTSSWAENALTASFVPTSSLVGNFFSQGGNSFGTTALLGTNDSQPLAFETNGSVRMFISSAGSYVGIGTTAPTYSLDVAGIGGNDGVIRSRRIIATGGTAGDPPITTTSTIAGLFEPSYANLGFSAYGGEAGRIESISRNWNIGMTGGTAKFNIRGSGSSSATNSLVVQNGTPTTLFLVRNDGNVGIGTLTPSYSLDVNGIARVGASDASGQLYIRGFEGAGQYIYLSDGATRNWSIVGGASYVIQREGSSVFLINSLGNVGIGVTSPAAKLHISGATTNGILVNGNGNIDLVLQAGNLFGGSGTIQLYAGNNNNSYLRLSGEYIREGANGGLGVGASSRETIASRFYISGSNNDILLIATSSFGPALVVSGSGNVGIGIATPAAGLEIANAENSTLRLSRKNNTGNFLELRGGTGGGIYNINTSGTQDHIFQTGGTERLRITSAGIVIITGSANITQALTASAALISGSGTQKLIVVGSGSAQPLFTVQGSQGELFSIVDSLSGSLFSVNDQSGLPIMEVFSDNTILMGNYLDPMLLTTTRTGSAAGINTLYTLPTSSYDAVYIDYTIRSGSNARAGNFMAMWSGTSVNFTDNSITEFGTTSGFIFGAHVSGSNMVVTGSSPTAGWIVKTIVKAI